MGLLKDPGSEKAWDPSLPVKIDFEWGGLTEDMKRAQAGDWRWREVAVGGGWTAVAGRGHPRRRFDAVWTGPWSEYQGLAKR